MSLLLDSESEVLEFRSNLGNDTDALEIGELEREVAQRLERLLGNLRSTQTQGRPVSGSLRLALSQPQEIPLQSGAQTTIHSTGTEGHHYVCKRRERDRGRQDRGKHLLAKWPRGKRPDKVRLLLEGLYSIL